MPFIPRSRLYPWATQTRLAIPAPDAVERILAEGTRLLRTDRDGAITISTDGQLLNVRSFFTCTAPCSELSSSAVSPTEATEADAPAF